MNEGISVLELRDLLNNAMEAGVDPDTIVVSSAPFGDRSNTLAAIPVVNGESSFICRSAYSDSGFAIDEDCDNCDPANHVFHLTKEY